MIEFQLKEDSDYIELIKLLKVVNLVSSGAEAKQLVEDGRVKLNGTIEDKKRAKVRSGDIVDIEGQQVTVLK
ncbi:MAG: RNA-binding S4 domain-containing protein [Bacteroidales bacterium]